MDDERVVSSIGRFSLVTGEVLMKALYLSVTAGMKIYQTNQASQHFTGETDWQAFLKTSSKKDIKEFLKSEVNLDAFKQELSKYGIGFAFQEQADGMVQFVYEFKNKAIVEQALSNVIRSLTQNKETAKRLIKTPKNMKPSEKIAYYKKKGEALSMLKDKKRTVSVKVEKGGLVK